MLRIESSAGKLSPLAGRALRAAPLAGVPDLRGLLAANPESLFAEVGLPLRLIAAEIPRPSGAPDPSQMLAVDAGGRIYVIALQVGDKAPELAPALEAGSIVSRWSPETFRDALSPQETNHIEAFLQAPFDRLNHGQGIVLIAERSTPEGLAVIAWLRQTYNLHLICLGLRRWVDDEAGDEFLAVDPAPLAANGQTRLEARPTLVAAPAAAPAERVVEAPPAAPADLEPPEPEVPWIEVPEPAEPRRFEGGGEEDPLADLLADIEKGRQPPALLPAPVAEAEEGAERRRAPRGTDYQARRLRLDYLGKPLGARVVDFSRVGIGVEVLSPLPINAEVRISGEILGGEGAVAVEGTARVAHCKSRPDGVCRIGFALEPENLRKVTAEAQDFDRR